MKIYPLKARIHILAYTAILTLITLTTFTTAQNIWDIQASFCNQNEINTELDLVTTAGSNTDICIRFQNNSLKDTTISLDFVDGAITPDWKKACFSAEKPKTNFGQYIQDYKNKLTIPGNSDLEQHFKINYPVWYSGISHGCLAYAINNESNIAGWIGIIFRKVHTIDILVWWSQINSDIKIQKTSFSWDQASNRLTFTIQNNGNTTQTIQISGTISNPFWFSQNFQTNNINIDANETKTLITDILNLPDYKWIFFTKSALSHQPKFNFDITNHNIPDQYTVAWIISISKTMILRNWFYIASLALILILISIIIFKRRK